MPKQLVQTDLQFGQETPFGVDWGEHWPDDAHVPLTSILSHSPTLTLVLQATFGLLKQPPPLHVPTGQSAELAVHSA